MLVLVGYVVVDPFEPRPGEIAQLDAEVVEEEGKFGDAVKDAYNNMVAKKGENLPC